MSRDLPYPHGCSGGSPSYCCTVGSQLPRLYLNIMTADCSRACANMVSAISAEISAKQDILCFKDSHLSDQTKRL